MCCQVKCLLHHRHRLRSFFLRVVLESLPLLFPRHQNSLIHRSYLDTLAQALGRGPRAWPKKSEGSRNPRAAEASKERSDEASTSSGNQGKLSWTSFVAYSAATAVDVATRVVEEEGMACRLRWRSQTTQGPDLSTPGRAPSLSTSPPLAHPCQKQRAASQPLPLCGVESNTSSSSRSSYQA